MDGANFLTRVKLDHYKSIAHCDVTLGSLSYLVGPNGAGKSNFLDALHFVADALNHSLDFALRKRGGLSEVIHRVNDKPCHFQIALEMALPRGDKGEYRIRIGWHEGRPEVLEEFCQVVPKKRPDEPKFFHLTSDDSLAGTVGAFKSNFSWSPHVNRGRLTLVNAGGTQDMRAVFDHLSRMRFYNISPTAFLRPETPSPEVILADDGANITDVLERLGKGEDSVKGRIEEYLRVILPTLDTIKIDDVGPGKMLRFWQNLASYKHPQPFWATAMSAGTLRALGILTALLQANVETGPTPSLVAIEEPESQVNPAVLAVFRDAIMEASYCAQVLITTHSPDLLDDKEVTTDSLLAVAAEEGVTQIGPIDASGRDVVRRRLSTPGGLLRFGQLQPENGSDGSRVPVSAGQEGL